ncbi:PAS domain S-box protein [Halodesulfurarchaeum sp.]|uniref:PAS domain S-box protein n=1 Tax=Halodesulfurarchaeum sp. TaxID=1980530 RepID=UPI002FC2E0F7
MGTAGSNQDDGSLVYVSADPSQAEQFAQKIEAVTGMTVLTRSTVTGGLEALATRPDLACIVSDYDLPDIDGIAFLQAVRVQFPDFPFILFTSEGNERVASKAITARVTEYLIKEHFQDHWSELGTLIAQSIGTHHTQRSITDPEARAKVILEAALDPMVIVQNETFRYANETALELFEVDTFYEFERRSVAEIVAPDSAAITTETIEAVQSGARRVERLEQTIVGQQGRKTPVELTAVSVEWNNAPAVLLIFRDISELRANQYELRRFRRAVEAAGHAIYVTDVDGTIEYANPAFEAVTGYEPAEAIGKTPRILNSGEMPAAYFENLWDTILAGEIWEESLINRRKDGELYHAHQTIAPITDRDGTLTAFVAIQTDISERERLRERLEESKERYQSLFKSIRDAILVFDMDRRIINCNQGFTDRFGYELSEIEGDHAKSVYAGEADYDEFREAVKGHIDDPDFTHTVTYEKQSGQTFPGETNVFYLRNADDEIVGFISIIRDVSDRRTRLHQLQMIDRVLQHNFHNDMNVIQGNAELLKDAATEEDVARASRIIETGDQLLETVEKERQVTKFLADPPARSTVEIGSVITRIKSEIESRYSNATIRSSLQESVRVTASAAIGTAIKELLTNAISHADEETPTATVAVWATDETVIVEVTDSNPTIPEMERTVLTGEKPISALYHGSGLGLWLVSLVVEDSNGVLEFEENEPRGNIIRIRLPRAEVD